MKKILIISCAAAAAVLLSGCSLYNTEVGNDISRFVKPSSSSVYDSIPSDEEIAALDNYVESVEAGLDGSGDEQTLSEQDALMATAGVEEGTFTLEDPDLDEEGNLICNGFKFYVPQLWRSRMLVEVITEDLHGYMCTTYNFYYIQKDNGSQALEMAIMVVPKGYYQSYGVTTGTRIVSDSGRGLEYFLINSKDALPDDFTDISGYSEVYSNLANQEDTITVIKDEEEE